MSGELSVEEAKATLSETIHEAERGDQRAAGPLAGLASLAGGWEGSEELVRLIESSPRGGRRSTPAPD